MNKRKQILPLIVALLVLTNIVTVVIGNYTLLKLKGVIEGHYIGEEALIDSDMQGINTNKEKEEEILTIMEKYIHLDDIEKDDIENGKYRGMMQALDDPYSVYMSKDEITTLTQDNSGQFGGVGVVITPGDDGLITVVSPIDGTPGHEAGIRSGDKIVKVDGKEYFGSTMSESVKKMRGEPGTSVNLTIQRENNDGSVLELEFDIVRDIITIQSVNSEMIDDIGYIRISSFDEKTAELFEDAITSLEEDNVRGFIIDLRGNPGGVLSSPIDIADKFLEEEMILSTVDREERAQNYFAKEGSIDDPLVVLVNKGSASASEILTGALKDNERALIVGEKTFGKGIVQGIYTLRDGSGVKITISEYYTPDGISIHGEGIQPDIEVELNESAEGIGLEYINEDNQLREAIKQLRGLMD